MQVENQPDSQRKQSIRRKRTVSTRKETMKDLPNGQVSLMKSLEIKKKSVFVSTWRNVAPEVAKRVALPRPGLS